MNTQEKTLIIDLFKRLKKAEKNSLKRDKEAESLIKKYNVNVYSMLKNGTVAVITMFGVWILFGIKNIMIAFPIALTSTVLGRQNFYVKTFYKVIWLIILDMLIVVTSFISSLNLYTGIIINFISIFLIMYSIISQYDLTFYKPFTRNLTEPRVRADFRRGKEDDSDDHRGQLHLCAGHVRTGSGKWPDRCPRGRADLCRKAGSTLRNRQTGHPGSRRRMRKAGQLARPSSFLAAFDLQQARP